MLRHWASKEISEELFSFFLAEPIDLALDVFDAVHLFMLQRAVEQGGSCVARVGFELREEEGLEGPGVLEGHDLRGGILAFVLLEEQV